MLFAVPSFLAPLNDLDLAVGQAAVAPFLSKDISTRLFGPDAGEGLQASSDHHIVAQTITTYPLWPGEKAHFFNGLLTLLIS